MMNKQKGYTAMGIALSFLIAVGGWTLTSMLIDKKSDALLSATGSIRIDTPSAISPTPVDQGDSGIEELLRERPKLTEDEIIKILQNWESSDSDRIAHEPTGEQLSMEQAIKIGEAGLSYFSEQGVIFVEPHEYENAKISAYLVENQPRGQNTLSRNLALHPYYSYWSVSFSNERMNTVLTINAVTGQIWIADITVHSAISNFNTVNLEDALTAFISHIGMSSEKRTDVKYDKNELSASQSFAGGMLHAVVGVKARASSVADATTAESAAVYTGIRMYLTTQTPTGTD